MIYVCVCGGGISKKSALFLKETIHHWTFFSFSWWKYPHWPSTWAPFRLLKGYLFTSCWRTGGTLRVSCPTDVYSWTFPVRMCTDRGVQDTPAVPHRDPDPSAHLPPPSRQAPPPPLTCVSTGDVVATVKEKTQTGWKVKTGVWPTTAGFHHLIIINGSFHGGWFYIYILYMSYLRIKQYRTVLPLIKL